MQGMERNHSRRRLLTMAAATPPALIAMSSRPSWATTSAYSISAYCSIHPQGQHLKFNTLTSHSPAETKTTCGIGADGWKNCYQQLTDSHSQPLNGQYKCKTGNYWLPNTVSSCSKSYGGPSCTFAQLTNCTGYVANAPYDSQPKNCTTYTLPTGSRTYSKISVSIDDVILGCAFICAHPDNAAICSGYPFSQGDIINMCKGAYKMCGVTLSKSECAAYVHSFVNSANNKNCSQSGYYGSNDC